MRNESSIWAALSALVVVVIGFAGDNEAAIRPNASGVSRIAEGNTQSCAVVGGTVRCWDVYPEDAKEVKGLREAGDVAVGLNIACAISGKETFCWRVEDDIEGQYALASCLDTSPVRVSELENAEQLSFIDESYCALLAGGTVKCWGELSPNADRLTPRELPGLKGAKKIAVAMSAVCAIMSDSRVRCWSPDGNAAGRLGEGRAVQEIPALEVDGLEGAVDLAGSHVRFHAVRDDGAVLRWDAWNLYGKSCGGTKLCGESYAPGEMPIVAEIEGVSDAVSIHGGLGSTACAVRESGNALCWAWCWGSASAERKAVQMVDLVESNVPISSLHVNERFTYVLLADGSAYLNEFGEEGNRKIF